MKHENLWSACRLALSAAALFSLACGNSSEIGDSPVAQGDLVIATYAGGTMTLEDLDRLLLHTVAEQSWDAELSTPQRLEDLARRVAVERIVLQRAQEEGEVPESAVKDQIREIERNVAMRIALGRIPRPSLGREDLEAYLEAHRDRFDLPERRRVFYIFKRIFRGADRESVMRELETLRDRANGGESFALLAREHSDSETRHRDGLLGVVKVGHFSEDFDGVVFSLDEGAISEPIFTADGGHLFFIADVFPARLSTVESLGLVLYREMLADRQRLRLETLAKDLLTAQGETLLQDRDLEAVLAQGPPPVLFRVGDFEFRRNAFQRLLRNSLDRPMAGGEEVKAQVLATLVRTYHQEIILHYGVEASDLPQADIERERQQVMAKLYLEGQLREGLAKDTARIEKHFQRNVGRFSKPVRVSVTRVQFSPPDPELMAKLESAVADLDRGAVDLETLATRYGGKVVHLGERSVAQLRAEDPRVLRFAFALSPGAHSPPYNAAGSLRMFRLDERLEPEPHPLEAVRGRVVEDIFRQESGALYEKFSDDLLETKRFSVHHDRLDRGVRLLARLPTE